MTIIAVTFATVMGIFMHVPIYNYTAIGKADQNPFNQSLNDKFGIHKIYPTKQNGREWYINMNNPNFGVFDPSSKISKDIDGSLMVNNHNNTYNNMEKSKSIENATNAPDENKTKSEIRVNVGTAPGEKNWKNVEMTGYVKVKRTLDNVRGDITWNVRGGVHNDKHPCDGTALKGRIFDDGTVLWTKEIWHTGGYTSDRAEAKITDSIIGKWIGWKIIIYNIKNDSAVKMESYLDVKSKNTWQMVSETTDNGGWYSNRPDNVFYSVDCKRPKDYVITNDGPIATFRSDNLEWNFKYLSIREIQPPVN